jgi:aerobic carbon-monoxide dehydrogenase large subunit
MLEVDEKDVAYQNGSFSVPGTDIQPLSFAKVARMAYLGHAPPEGTVPGLDETLFYDPPGMSSPSGVHMAYIEVDTETGIVDILDYLAVDDGGTLINPLLAAGQIHGSGSGNRPSHLGRGELRSGQWSTDFKLAA